jgi:D-glycero-D-manno-heptose 1,7-bisphosphate phosphatase
MKLVILDRDGVINQDSDEYIKSPEEWTPIPGSLEAIAKLNQAGFTVVIASNQSGVGRGYFDLATLEKMHDKMKLALKEHQGHIDRIYFCPHIPDDNCSCRKPKPGLFKQIANDFNIQDATDVYAIGDNYRDIQAAQAIPCQQLLVLTGKGEKTLEKHQKELKDIKIFNTLFEAVDFILGKNI